MSETYDPKTIEEKWQRVWDDARAWHVDNPADPDAADRGQELRRRDAPVSLGLAAPGAPARLHDRRRRHALPAPQRPERPPSDGLGRLRPAGREQRDQGGRAPARDHRAQHRQHPPDDAPDGVVARLGAGDLDPRSALLPLAAVAVPPLPRAGAGLPQGRAGEVVPERPDRDRERAGAPRRHVRALRRARRVPPDGAMVLPDHRLRRRARSTTSQPSTGPTRSRRASGTGSGAPRAPSSTSGSRSGARTSPSSPHGRTRSSGRRSSCSRRSTSWFRGSSRRRCRRTCATPRRRRPRSARLRSRRRVSSRACTRSTRSTASGSRSTSPTTSSPTTAPARSWPSPPTTSATTTSLRRSVCRCAR